VTASTRVQTVRTRIGNLLPAAASWAVVVATVVGLTWFPFRWIWVAVASFAYFVIWLAVHLVFYVVGLRRCREWGARDWDADRDTPGPAGFAPADVWHVALMPNHTEPVAILRRTLDTLAAQRDAAERLVVVLGMEEREEGSRAKGEVLAEEYEGRFARVIVTSHPSGLPGELPCKAANMRWSAIAVREELDRMGVDPKRTTLTVCDADSVFDRHYFAAIAELFCRDEGRYSRFWQAPLLYYSNMWQVPAPVRFTARLTQLYMLAELALPGYDPLPISTYTMSLRLGEECDWWDPAVIAEDWHVYLDYMVQRAGDVSMVTVYLPVLLDSAGGATWLSALRNRYVQLRRHAWGATDTGFLTEQLLMGRGDSSVWFRFFQVLHDHVLPIVGFGMAATLSFVPVFLRASAPGAAAGSASDITLITLVVTGLFSVSTIALLASMAIDIANFPPPGGRAAGFVIEMAKMWLLLPVAGLVFGVLPALDAQTKLALGLPLEWKVTPKRFRRDDGPGRESAPASATDPEA
jgi:hypothetical protein